ncbi:hypothetical protein E2C01_055950 [Portunus trituberculatus]|uniref:Uncharacterized protein n=1 Tax=Portunus trituberculatus TaxID=210409 RepID=A0A5B7GW43_PORTR|nr:hypothetical protein [Portunus trituberculatus]
MRLRGPSGEVFEKSKIEIRGDRCLLHDVSVVVTSESTHK